MTPEEYAAFLSKGIVRKDDPLRLGLSRHTSIMSLIAELSKNDPAMVMAIGRLIDQLIGSVVVQHLEAAATDPMSVPDVIKLMRGHLEAKLKKQ
jgi:hypothetical protein